MSYTLTLEPINVLTGEQVGVKKSCDCDEARHGCSPAFVFSAEGQIQFRTALIHLAVCRKMCCRILRARVFNSMETKLDWLVQEDSLLGCPGVQSFLYGSGQVAMQRKDFTNIANHLAVCDSDSCAQLLRALLLSIRDEMNMF